MTSDRPLAGDAMHGCRLHTNTVQQSSKAAHTCDLRRQLHAGTNSFEGQLLLELHESMCLGAHAGDD